MSNVSDNNNEKYTFIHYRELPRFGLPGETVAAKAGMGADDVDLLNAAEELKTFKTLLCSYLKNQIKSMIVQGAIEENMTVYNCDVKTFDDVETSWEIDGSLQNAEKVFKVLYCNFEKKQERWSRILEENFMKENRIKYKMEGLDKKQLKKKGCIEEQAINTLTYLRKLINRKGMNSHGYRIVITRPTDKISELGKNWRRRKGVFFPWMRQKFDCTEQKERKRKYDTARTQKKKEIEVISKLHDKHVEEIKELRKENAKKIVNSTYAKKTNKNSDKGMIIYRWFC